MTDSKTDSKTNGYFTNRVVDPRAWGDMTDSDDDEPDETVTKPVTNVTKPVTKPIEPVTPKTWAKLPVHIETVTKDVTKTVTKDATKDATKTVTKDATKGVTKDVTKTSNGIRTLMVKNLPRDTTPEKLAIELRSIFKTYGPIKDVYIPINRDGHYAGTIKGFAKVQFHNPEHSSIAVTHSFTIRKNTLIIEYAREDR